MESKIVGVRIPPGLLQEIRAYQESLNLKTQSETILTLLGIALNTVKHETTGDSPDKIELLRSELFQAIADLRSELLGKIQETSQGTIQDAIAVSPDGLTNVQLSEQTGISLSTIQKWARKVSPGGSPNSRHPEAGDWIMGENGLWLYVGSECRER
jgi:sRNA-binding carbon storage regulator CsrA